MSAFLAIPKDKEKRRKLALVVVITVATLAGLWFGLLSAQYQNLTLLQSRIDETQHKFDVARKALASAAQLEADLDAAAEKLNRLESGMATGDLAAWIYDRVRQFKLSHRVEIPQFGSISQSETTLLAKFPYQQVRMSIAGNGFFHDIGKFVAAFENEFPHMRLENLELEPAPVTASSEKEKLNFRANVVALVRATSTANSASK